jgi:hypothetical protein
MLHDSPVSASASTTGGSSGKHHHKDPHEPTSLRGEGDPEILHLKTMKCPPPF